MPMFLLTSAAMETITATASLSTAPLCSGYRMVDLLRSCQPHLLWTMCVRELAEKLNMNPDELGEYREHALSSSSSGQMDAEDPKKVYPIILFLLNHLVSHKGSYPEGIFRVSGNKKIQRELQFLLLKPNQATLGYPLSSYTLVDISGVLRSLMNEHFHLPDWFVNLLFLIQQHLANSSPPSTRMQCFQLLLLLLSRQQRQILQELFHILHSISQQAGSSKMDARNLSICFHSMVMLKRDKCSHPAGIPACHSKSVDTMHKLYAEATEYQCVVQYFIEMGEQLFQVPANLLLEMKHYLNKSPKMEMPISPKPVQRMDIDYVVLHRTLASSKTQSLSLPEPTSLMRESFPICNFRKVFSRSRSRANYDLWGERLDKDKPAIRCISYNIRQSQRRPAHLGCNKFNLRA